MLPEGMDPDDYFKSNSLEDFKKLEEDSADAFDFFVKNKVKNIDKKNYAKLTSVLNSIFDYICIVESELVRNSLIKRTAELLEINQGVVSREFVSYKSKTRKYSNDKTAEINDKETEVEKATLNDSLKKEIDLVLLMLKLSFNESSDLIKHCGLRIDHFSNEIIKLIFNLYYIEKKLVNTKDFIDQIDDNFVRDYIEERLFSEEFKQSEIVIRNNVIDRIIDVLDEYYENLSKDLNTRLKLGELYEDIDFIKSLLEEKNIIVNERTKLPKLRELKSNV